MPPEQKAVLFPQDTILILNALALVPVHHMAANFTGPTARAVPKVKVPFRKRICIRKLQ
jgi:hypothetical protein